jgi:tRNA uridine 5-carboxymethylaminomethyl modification enzyme
VGYALGLVSQEEYDQVQEKYAAVEREIQRLEHSGTSATEALSAMLVSRGEPEAKHAVKLSDLLRRPRVSYEDLAPFDPDRPALDRLVTEQVEIQLKYQGYIDRQQRQVAEAQRMESHALPADLDYDSLNGLRLEAREKLKQIRPMNLGQASRISGVSPADIAALMIYLGN